MMILISKSLAERLIRLLPQLTPISNEITDRLELQRKTNNALHELEKKIKAEVLREQGVTVSPRVAD